MRHLFPALLTAAMFPGSPAAASPPHDRHVVLTDFARAPAPVPRFQAQSQGNTEMAADYAAMDWLAPSGAVPGAASLSALPEAEYTFNALCRAHLYRPSTMLRPEAEERRRRFYPAVTEVACAEGVPVALIDALLIQESGYNPLALSPKGAFGLGQLMPATAHNLGVDRFNPRANLHGTARYLRVLLTQFGQVPLALAAYNAGPRRVQSAGGLPPIRETLHYVKQVLVNWATLERETAAPSDDKQ